MAAKGKEFPLSIVIKTVDRATSGIKRVNDQLDKTFKPLRDLSKEAGRLYENMGISKITSGFRGIGSVVKSTAIGFGVMAASAGLAVRAFKGLVDEYDQLGARAERIGISVDALAQLQFAAEKSDVEVSELDSALGSFNKGLGQASAGVGRMASFLKKVSPELLKQLKGAKSSEEAFGLMADAMVKVKDPAKRTALAMAVFGGSGAAMIPLLTKGSAGVDELKKRFVELAGPQAAAAAAAGGVDDAMKDTAASMKGVKAAILEGLGPAFEDLARRASKFISENREKIGAWARDFGEKLPARIQALIDAFRRFKETAIDPVVRVIRSLVEGVGGADNAVKLLIGTWLAFKAVAMVGHLASIAKGLIGIATAAGTAAKALAGVKAAEVAAGAAPGGAATVAAGGARGAAGTAARAVPWLAAVYAGATSAAGVVDEDQDRKLNAKDRGAAVLQDLKRLRDRGGGRVARTMLAQSLASGGFIDPKTGRVAETMTNRDALTGGELLQGVGFNPQKLYESKMLIEEMNAALSSLRPTLGAEAVGGRDAGPPAQPVAGTVTIDIPNLPKGARVTTSPDTKGVDLAVGWQLW